MALDRYLVEEVALDCADGMLSRREAVRRLLLLGLTAPAAAALLAGCGSDDEDSVGGGAVSTSSSPVTSSTAPSTSAATSTSSVASETTAGVGSPTAELITFAGPRGDLMGVLALTAEPKGAVLVIHENRGLSAHIRTLPGRLAADGYTTLAIDLLSEEGGTASLPSEGDATAALGAASSERLIADLRAGLDELQRRAPDAKLAAIGFCFGGGMTWQLLDAGEPRLSAAVPFYGPAPQDADFSGSPNAAVLGVYAELDDRVNASQGVARAALEDAGLVHEIKVFPGVNHAFFNDTSARYDATQAAAAYVAMLEWFEQHLTS